MSKLAELDRDIEIITKRAGFSPADQSAIKALTIHKKYLETMK